MAIIEEESGVFTIEKIVPQPEARTVQLHLVRDDWYRRVITVAEESKLLAEMKEGNRIVLDRVLPDDTSTENNWEPSSKSRIIECSIYLFSYSAWINDQLGVQAPVRLVLPGKCSYIKAAEALRIRYPNERIEISKVVYEGSAMWVE